MEEKYIKGIIFATIAILVGLAFWTILGDSVGTLANIQTTTNASFTMPANGSTKDLTPCGQLNTTAIKVYNQTNGTGGSSAYPFVTATNYSVTQATGNDGFLSARIKCTAGAVDYFCGHNVNVTCSYQPKGYITDSAGRGIALMIPIFAALLIMIAAIPDLREWVINKVGGQWLLPGRY